MRAAWYDRQGPASDVLRISILDEPHVGPGEVRVRVSTSGINPGDVKKRRGWLGSAMSYPRVIPHSDGAGVIDAAGEDVEPGRVGQRVWVYGAQSYRPFGTAAELVVVPAVQAVPLPDQVSDSIGACLGIPGITAHRAVFVGGPSTGTVLVQGVLGAVGSIAAQLARRNSNRTIGTVRNTADLDKAGQLADDVVALDNNPVDTIAKLAPAGVQRIIEVALSTNADLDSAVICQDGVIAAYSSPADRTEIPFWPMLFSNVTLCLLGSDDFSPEAKIQAAQNLTAAAATGLELPIRTRYSLEDIARAHDDVEHPPNPGRVLLDL